VPIDDILVLGGTGFIGRAVCEKLVERSGGGSARVRVPTRHIAHARPIQFLPTLEAVAADLHHDAQLARLVDGRDAVINLVARLHGSEAEFHHLHVELPRRLARACEAAGVRRVIHVSALGASASAPSRYLRSKAAGEAALRAAELELTVLRPSIVFGERDHFLNLFAALQRIFPVMPLACAQARFQPVWVEDVAAAIVACLDQRWTVGEVIECAGPQEYTLRQLVQLAGRWSGHPRPVIGLPAALGRLQARMLELLPGEPLMSRDNLDSMQVPNVASGQHPGLQALGIQPTPLEGVGPSYLGGGRDATRLDPWRARHS
jgi:NADH dehydrogenase